MVAPERESDDFDPKQLLAQEHVVAVLEDLFSLDADECPVPRPKIGHRQLPTRGTDLGVPAGDERIIGEVDVVALATEHDALNVDAEHPADRPAAELTAHRVMPAASGSAQFSRYYCQKTSDAQKL